jgi:hypothetical protein
MAEFFVHNSLNTSKSVKFNISLRRFVVKGDYDGDHKWVLEIGTTHSGSDGSPHLVKKIHNISESNLDSVIETALSDLCSKIDWSPYVDDKESPYVVSVDPTGSDIPIGSNIYVTIQDKLPSAGIDLSNLKVTLNNGTVDFDITSEMEVQGDPYQYQLKWVPPKP